jgi:TetR/AcrR family transcriptional regulator, transcriptional repressor for nem operon
MLDVMGESEFTGGCLLGNMAAEVADHSSLIRGQVKDSLDAWSDSIEESLRAAQSVGELDAGLDPERLARFLLNAWEGALLRCKVEKSVAPLDEFLTVTFDLLLH